MALLALFIVVPGVLLFVLGTTRWFWCPGLAMVAISLVGLALRTPVEVDDSVVGVFDGLADLGLMVFGIGGAIFFLVGAMMRERAQRAAVVKARAPAAAGLPVAVALKDAEK